MLPSQLGVITPYEGQRAHVVATLLRHGPLRQDMYKAVEVSSVDAFQVCWILTCTYIWQCSFGSSLCDWSTVDWILSCRLPPQLICKPSSVQGMPLYLTHMYVPHPVLNLHISVFTPRLASPLTWCSCLGATGARKRLHHRVMCAVQRAERHWVFE